MDNFLTHEKQVHQHLFRLNEDLNMKLINHMLENDMSLSGTVRCGLRLLFENEERKKIISDILNTSVALQSEI